MPSGSMNFNLNLLANVAGFRQGMDGARFAVNALVTAMAALGVGVSIQGLVEVTDTYTNLTAKINIATQGAGNFEEAMAGVHRVAIATNANLSSTADLFTRLNAVGKDMGMTQQQALDLTQTVTQAIQIGGSSAEASDAAITQFIQAMQGGVLRGEEFNSIMEGGYGLAEALARGLGVTTGELRKMAEAGELSAERVIKALEGQKDQVSQIYGQFPTTIGNALQRIQTQWQILIGEMDQANGASAEVAKGLIVIADNLNIVGKFIEDIGSGFVWIGDQLKQVDSVTIEQLKTAVSEAYTVVKSLISNLADIGGTVTSAFSSVLDAISPLFGALLHGQDNVSGFTIAVDALRMGLAVVSDTAFVLNIGLKTVLSAIQFLSGGLYALSAQALDFLGFDTLAQQALNASDRMFAQADKNITDVKKLSEEHKWAVVATYQDISKTQAEKNAEDVVNNKAKLDELKKQEADHSLSYKSISDERIRLSQQLHDAQKAGNQDAIDSATFGLNKLQEKENAFALEKKQLDADKIKAAQDYADSVILSAGEQDKALSTATKQTIEAELATRGLKAEFDATGKVAVSALESTVKSTDNVSASTDQARKAATALGIDLDVSLKRVSAGFKESENNLNKMSSNIEGLGVTGEQASNLIYEGWVKWLETAKSQAEIDYAKQKLEEFGNQGKVSTSQVEQGLIAIKMQAQKLPADIDPVTESFKRLGIETKENLKLAAQQAMMDFINVRDSGKATAEGVQKAYEKAIQSAHASGDAATIANANAKASSLGLKVQIDETGKASVESMDAVEKAVHRVRDSAHDSVGGFRAMGNAAREAAQEAKHSIDQWNDALTAKNEAQNAERKERNANRTSSFESYSRADVLSELKGMGYDDAQAKKFANSIMSSAFAKDDSAALSNYGTGNANMLNSQFEALRKQGLTSSYGTDEVRRQLANLANGTGAVSVDTGTKSTRRLEISNGNSTAVLTGSDSDVDVMEQILSEFEMLKKST